MANKKAAVLHGEIKDIILNYARQLALESFYPIGTIYFSANNVSPQNFFGGVWEAIPNDTFMVVGSGNSANNNITIQEENIKKINISGGSHHHELAGTNQSTDSTGSFGSGSTKNGVGGIWTVTQHTVSFYEKDYANHQLVSDEEHTHTIGLDNPTAINLANSVKRITLYAWKRVA